MLSLLQADFAHLSKAPGVIGTVVVKLLGRFVFPVVGLYWPTNESTEAWKALLSLLFQKLPHLENQSSTVVCTDGFPGVATLAQEHGVTHSRCVHHLAFSVLKLCKGRSIESELWRASRAHTFPKFVRHFKDVYTKNPSAAFFLCPPLAHHYATQSGDEVVKQNDIVKKKVIEMGLAENSELMPTLAEMKKLATDCYGVTESEISTPLKLYIHLISLIQAETSSSSSATSCTPAQESVSEPETEPEEDVDEEGKMSGWVGLRKH